ncbi:MAG: three-Cys-motif partner protein TcmP [Pseudolabrys sp.]
MCLGGRPTPTTRQVSSGGPPPQVLRRQGQPPQAKHEILTRYLDAWFPIMASWNTKVLFIDGFAGPGRYAGGEPGSPELATESALKRQGMLRGSTVMLCFNESDKARYGELESWASAKAETVPANFELIVQNEEFVDLAQHIVDTRGGRSLVPTFAFVDPFGFSGVPIELIADLVRDKRSELFILFSFNSANRWIRHPEQQVNMRDLFGCDDYLEADSLVPLARKEFLAGLYERQLRDYGNFPYVSRFQMIEKSGRTSYFLYHCTRNLKGLEVMRSAIWKIDPTSGRQFSDRVAGLESIFEGPIAFDLEERLLTRFAGQRVPIKTLQDFVLTDTPFAPEHLKKRTLKPLQERGLIEVTGQKKRGTFPDGVEVRFLS